MAVKLSEADLPDLLSWLANHLPLCIKVHGELKSHLKGHFPGIEFFVDRWPHPQAVVAREDPAGEQTMSQICEMSIFGVNEKSFSDLLKDPGVAAWNKGVLFSAVPNSMKQALEAVAEEMGKSVTVCPVGLFQSIPKDCELTPVPEGVKVQPISDAEIKMIYSTWKFSFTTKETYIQNCVKIFPSVYLVTENGHHVGHMIGTSFGAMGLLYVNPEFRGKGYSKVIVSQLSQKFFDSGENAYVFVEAGNLISENLHKSVGFREMSQHKFIWLDCH